MEIISAFWYRNICGSRSIEGLSLDELYGDKLRYALELLKMRQTDLSRMTGIDRYSISKYVNGSRVPDANNAFKIFNALWKEIADRWYGGQLW